MFVVPMAVRSQPSALRGRNHTSAAPVRTKTGWMSTSLVRR